MQCLNKSKLGCEKTDFFREKSKLTLVKTKISARPFCLSVAPFSHRTQSAKTRQFFLKIDYVTHIYNGGKREKAVIQLLPVSSVKKAFTLA